MNTQNRIKPGYPVNKFLEGSYGPVNQEQVIEQEQMTVIGEIPKDMTGVYVRNGPNLKHDAVGKYHRYDGDGMLHSMHFRGGRATYRNKWIRTKAFIEEEKAGHGIYHGMLGHGHEIHPHMPVKDTANTDVVLHGGKLVTTWYLSGDPYCVDPITLETEGEFTFNGARQGKVSAHGKTDENTDEFLYFDYNREAPYMHYGVVDSKGNQTTFMPVELPGPRMPHDMWFSTNYTILHDMPLVWDDDAYAAGKVKLVFHEDWATRFAVIPRHGSESDIRWYEFEPCYILHTINAYEEGDWLHMVGHRINPHKDQHGNPDLKSIAAIMGRHGLDARLYKWSVNLKTGMTKEGLIDDKWNAEFPTWKNSLMGTNLKNAYCVEISLDPLVHFAGVIKFNTETGESEHYTDGPGYNYSETPFAPADNAESEDDGYLVSFIWNANEERSEVHIFDARDVAQGPICRILLPVRIPQGFHATWARGDLLPAM